MSHLFSRRHLPFLVLMVLGFSTVLFGVFRDDEDEDEPSKVAAVNHRTGNTLSGTVTINGTALTYGGTLFLFGRESTQPAASGVIQPNGTYSIENAPTGAIQLCFSTAKELGKRPTDSTPGKNGRRGRKLGLGQDSDKAKELVIFKKKSPGTNHTSVAERTALKERLIDDMHAKKETAKLVEEAARKYGRLGLPDAIKTVLLEGDNSFDIDLKVSTPEQH